MWICKNNPILQSNLIHAANLEEKSPSGVTSSSWTLLHSVCVCEVYHVCVCVCVCVWNQTNLAGWQTVFGVQSRFPLHTEDHPPGAQCHLRGKKRQWTMNKVIGWHTTRPHGHPVTHASALCDWEQPIAFGELSDMEAIIQCGHRYLYL